ncbi:T9SS type A sorting domain-containing protein [uncultured Fibrobacter sp.]|uniref:T9SS type A sorting domain-containing protein n=1 Tax=uncultured Fibrobacter sp. TaxID=261512 RepID=UPI0025E3DB0A|nr:T9SS type A sorting domain-containing protein [uncultured Fibrobacter sp.]
MNKKISFTTVVALTLATFAGAFTTWRGDTEKVETGLDNDTQTGGYWFDYNDSADKGLSRVEWPVKKGNESDTNSLQPIIEHCHGICGHVVLSGAALSYDPFVGIGFNVVGEASADDKTPVAANATDWEGIFITYSSTLAAVLELGLGDVVDKSLEYDNPVAKLPKSTDGTTKQIRWEDFAQAGWGKGEKISGPEAAAKLVSIKFKIQAKDGTEGNFHIFEIGALSNPEAIKVFRASPSVNAVVSGRKVSFTGIASSAAVEIINLRGQIVKKGSVQGTSALDLSALDAGVYVVRASGKSVDFSGKIVLK